MARVARAKIQEREDLEKQDRVLRRLLKVKKACNSLIDFTELTLPSPDDPSDATKTRYQAQFFHKALAHTLEEIERGKYRRVIITFPPRHGKSELTSRRFPAWFVGRDPYRSVILATYNQPFAEDFGRDVRGVMQTEGFKQAFPNCTLRKGSAASDRLMTEAGGLLVFVGRGGSVTGRGGDLLIIDDPLKNSEEADSADTREKLWTWFNRDLMSRAMTDTAAVIIIQTRWHEDDLVGRLTDPENPCYDEEEAAQWKVFNIAAIAKMYGAPEDDPLNRKPGEVLWPQRFSREYLETFRRRDPRGFSALYQQSPTQEDGELFKRDHLRFYTPNQVPDRLRIYAASDYALTKKQTNDATVHLIAGVDEADNIWLLDCWWDRQPPDVVVERQLDLAQARKPILWWAGRGHITKSIGPFLRKRMLERRVYVNVVELPDEDDKIRKAGAILGRFAMGMVWLPKNASWTMRAVAELLGFPNKKFNDFVDALAQLGLGLDSISGPGHRRTAGVGPKVGTLGWVKEAARVERADEMRARALKGM